jgi:hypothetical protein
MFCNKCGYPFPEERPLRPAVVHGGRTARAARTGAGHRTGAAGFLSFDTLITGTFTRLIYLAGAIVIVLVSIMGIAGSFAKPGSGAVNTSFMNTTALAQNPAGSPLFWIVFLAAGSLLWRMFCEVCMMLFRLYDTISPDGEAAPEEEMAAAGDAARPANGEPAPVEYVKCPRCGKVVTVDQLRECEHCGVQGCSNCIRMIGLLKKTMTCKDCFERK